MFVFQFRYGEERPKTSTVFEESTLKGVRIVKTTAEEAQRRAEENAFKVCRKAGDCLTRVFERAVATA